MSEPFEEFPYLYYGRFPPGMLVVDCCTRRPSAHPSYGPRSTHSNRSPVSVDHQVHSPLSANETINKTL